MGRDEACTGRDEAFMGQNGAPRGDPKHWLGHDEALSGLCCDVLDRDSPGLCSGFRLDWAAGGWVCWAGLRVGGCVGLGWACAGLRSSCGHRCALRRRVLVAPPAPRSSSTSSGMLDWSKTFQMQSLRPDEGRP